MSSIQQVCALEQPELESAIADCLLAGTGGGQMMVTLRDRWLRVSP